ncbi:MAG: exosortase-associated EpsI family protein [Planctomycetaceae bacterium]
MTLFSTLPGRLAIACVCVAATQAAAWHLDRQTRSQASQALELDVAKLPMQLGEWSGVDTEIDARLVAHVGSKSIVNRKYEDGLGRTIIVHLAEFPAAEVSIPHPPPLCYTNAGWTIVRERWREVAPGVRFREMKLDREGAKVDVTYWYQLGPHVAGNRDDLRKILQSYRFSRDPWPPMVKVLLHAPGDDPDGQAGAAFEQFAAAIFDWIKSQS